MSNEQILDLLVQIKQKCKTLANCRECPFFTINEECQFMELAWVLYDTPTPAGWNIERIKRIIELDEE